MAIIGVSGYAGSGKDTVGKMIQIATCVPGSITTPLEELLADYDNQQWWLEEQSGWKIKKWAGKLKVVASMLTGIPIEKFEDQEFKKTYLPEQWNYWTISLIDNGKLLLQHGRYNTKEEAEGFIPFLKQNYGEFRMEYTVGMQQMTVRQFLQELGTDTLRDGLHPNTWVNALMADYVAIGDILLEGEVRKVREEDLIYPNWVITDTRFPNEAQAIKKAGGFIIRVDRPGVNAINAHPSETALDDWGFDYRIGNASDLTSLMLTVCTILINEKVLE